MHNFSLTIGVYTVTDVIAHATTFLIIVTMESVYLTVTDVMAMMTVEIIVMKIIVVHLPCHFCTN